jgi:cyanate permease
MTFGAMVAAAFLLALSQVHSRAAYYLAWTGLGVAMAMVLYEPAFSVVATWFVRDRDRALVVLTVLGGLASTVVVPLAAWLEERQGWRGAMAALAIVLACSTAPLAGFLLRRSPAAVGQHPDGDERAARPEGPAVAVSLRPVLADARFWALTIAFSLMSAVAAATCSHLYPYLTGEGSSPGWAAGAVGMIGVMQLPGRLAFRAVRRRMGWRWAAVAVFMAQALSLAALAASAGGIALVAFVVLFGLGNGVGTLLRATILAELYGASRYGRVGGWATLVATVGRSAGPVATSALHASSESYGLTFALLAVVLASAAAAFIWAPSPASPGGTAPTVPNGALWSAR